MAKKKSKSKKSSKPNKAAGITPDMLASMQGGVGPMGAGGPPGGSGGPVPGGPGM